MSPFPIRIDPFGEHAVLLQWPDRVDEAILGEVISFGNVLSEAFAGRNCEQVPAYNSLLLLFNDGSIDFNSVRDRIEVLYREKKDFGTRARLLWHLPICYGAGFALDADFVSEKLQLPFSEIVERHSQQTYTVFALGFLPGFMYLGGLPPELEVPRRDSPRPLVPVGAVGLAGRQTGIYPRESPGGWQIIGRCPVPLFDPDKERPCFVNVGDKVRFEPISKAEYDLIQIENEVGIYKVENEDLDA